MNSPTDVVSSTILPKQQTNKTQSDRVKLSVVFIWTQPLSASKCVTVSGTNWPISGLQHGNLQYQCSVNAVLQQLGKSRYPNTWRVRYSLGWPKGNLHMMQRQGKLILSGPGFFYCRGTVFKVM